MSLDPEAVATVSKLDYDPAHAAAECVRLAAKVQSMTEALAECARVIPPLTKLARLAGHPDNLADICEADEAARVANWLSAPDAATAVERHARNTGLLDKAIAQAGEGGSVLAMLLGDKKP